MTHPLVRVLAGAVTVLVLVGLAPSPAQAGPAADYANAAFKATNERRVAHDRVRLSRGDCLQRYARRQAIRMAEQRRMFHQDLGPILRNCHMSMVGENVAYGYPTGRATVRAWMNSPGHRANILEPRYRRMGLAARKGSDGRWYVSQVFGRRA
ncbi:CAP domain-containing protein [Nocardioides guangzhouensis]|nr:CAP domain-containing protein [Nocardioides guangzhouensis]